MLLSKSNKLLTGLFLTILFSSITSIVMSAELKINVKDIQKMEGHLLIALYDNKESFDSGKAKWSSKVKVDKNQHTITFEGLPAGEYAVKLYHDANDNNELDSNMFGIPKEGYGFSNNGGRFGPSDYAEAKFTISENTGIEINLL